MEFKGTKEKWKLAENEYGYYTSVRNLDESRKVCVSRVNNQIESNANMLLISKAPEMLEMLKELRNAILSEDYVRMLANSQLAKELIKEATTI